MTHGHDDERRALEEAALLPEADPRRREVVRTLDAVTDKQREEWCVSLAENEDLRLRLRGVEVPSGLLARVRSVRDGIVPARRRRATPLAGFLVAAAVLLVAVSVFVVRSRGKGSADLLIHELATLAAMDHAARPELTIKTDDPDTLEAALRGDAPFGLNIASPEPGAVLVGGRVCSFGDRPLVYTCWVDAGDDVALYQVRRSEFGLGARWAPRDVDIPARGSPPSRCRVRVWTDAEFAYVVVHDRRQRSG
ncbi:MAG: hypothetical protein L0271_13300 [Gemmatimonadetes bacterium]|nr:hypothetical protein [Gemmatimonadota bacterium]